MWAVEAKKFGDEPEYFYVSGLSATQSKTLHKSMANSGEWGLVRSWDLDAEAKQKESDERLKNYKGPLTLS